MTELDIWRSANLLLKQHGDAAVFIAAQRADGLLDLGDPDGCRTWLRIANAIAELEKTRAGNADTLH